MRIACEGIKYSAQQLAKSHPVQVGVCMCVHARACVCGQACLYVCVHAHARVCGQAVCVCAGGCLCVCVRAVTGSVFVALHFARHH